LVQNSQPLPELTGDGPCNLPDPLDAIRKQS
jgi:hypothetical protein